MSKASLALWNTGFYRRGTEALIPQERPANATNNVVRPLPSIQ